MEQARQVQVAAKPVPVQFGRTQSADFEANTLTVEMDPGYVVAVGPVAIVPRGTFDQMQVALRGAKTVLELAAAGKDGQQYANLETRSGSFVAVTATLLALEAAIAAATGASA